MGLVLKALPDPFFSVPEAPNKKKCRKGAPKASQKELLVRAENLSKWTFGDLGPSWGLDGGPDGQNRQNNSQNYKQSTYFLSKFKQSTHSCSSTRFQTNKLSQSHEKIWKTHEIPVPKSWKIGPGSVIIPLGAAPGSPRAPETKK